MLPTNARHRVVLFGMSLAVLAYIDRTVIAQAAPLISAELGFDKVMMGTVLSAFLLGYGLFEIPGGWYGDWVGARKGLMRIVLAWSAFTALTGAAWSFTSMVVIRFLFGVGEAGCFPIIAKSFTTWLPRSERTRAQGLLWMAARWGGAFTPLLVVWVLQFVNWRTAFVLFGLLGIVWAVFFYKWYRDSPHDHPAVNAAELALMPDIQVQGDGHVNVPWGRLLTSQSVLLLAAQYYFLSFGWYFFLTWLPTYLQEHHRLTPAQSAAYAVFPLFFNGLGSLFCGMVTPSVNRLTGDDVRTRKIMAITGFVGAGSFLMLATRMPDVNSTMAMMAAASFFNDLVMPHAWASCMDVGGRYAASVSGTMNLMGNLAGASSTMIGGFLLSQAGGNWNQFITILAAVYFLGVPCWALIDPRTPIEGLATRAGLASQAGGAFGAEKDRR
jgi:ACS family glucarate transporter-like MFS transporter